MNQLLYGSRREGVLLLGCVGDSSEVLLLRHEVPRAEFGDLGEV